MRGASWITASGSEVDVSKGSASALVMGRIKKLRHLTSFRPEEPAAKFQRVDGARGSVLVQAPRGFARPRPPSRLDDFCELNVLDKSCMGILQSLTPREQEWIMDKGFHIQADPSRGNANAVVMGRIASMASQAITTTCTQEEFDQRIQDFIMINNLDERCTEALYQLQPAQLAGTMEAQGYWIRDIREGGKASAIVMGRCRRA